ncbi:hypothetical protein EXN66_Car002029 [Channa argus]|uniref:Uncharacterized protein n=1 Tax=Channa argus TaxID=215402 RepID=A0A6G1P7Y5_CHAAH|nr:hypothetical protein EXN66_Car002029 [Channa argus]
MCLIYSSRMENKKQPHTDLKSTQDMHIKKNVCLTEQSVLFYSLSLRKERLDSVTGYVPDQYYCIA